MQKRISAIDGLKTIAFILVFISHVPRFNFSHNPFGCAGVSLFFVISGFLGYYTNYRSIQDKAYVCEGGVHYYRRFLQKNYFLHLLTFVAAAVMQQFWLHRWFSIAGYWDVVKKAISNLLLIQSFIPDGNYYYGFNSVSWYLSDLAFMYLILPIMLKIVNKTKQKNAKLFILCLICVSTVISCFSSYWNILNLDLQWLLYISPIMRTFDFLMGMILAKLVVTEQKHFGHRKLFIVIGILLFVAAMFFSQYVSKWMSYSIIYLPGTLMIVYSMTFGGEDNSIIKNILSWKGFCYATSVSLEMYLIHQVVINYVEYYCNDICRLTDIQYYFYIIGGTIGISVFLKILCTSDRRGMITKG